MRRKVLVRVRAAALALLAGATLAACSNPAPSEQAGPTGLALRLFELARQGEPAEQQLAECFGPLPDDTSRAALLDALELLAEATTPRVLAEERVAGLALTVVDLTAALPGEGSADYSVHLEGSPEEGWTIRWFRGPGVEWPRQRGPLGQGLTSSAPPR